MHRAGLLLSVFVRRLAPQDLHHVDGEFVFVHPVPVGHALEYLLKNLRTYRKHASEYLDHFRLGDFVGDTSRRCALGHLIPPLSPKTISHNEAQSQRGAAYLKKPYREAF